MKPRIDQIGAPGVPDGALVVSDGSNVPTTSDQVNNPTFVPAGTTAQRPATPTVGALRQNTDTGKLECWNGSSWINVGGGQTATGWYMGRLSADLNYTAANTSNLLNFTTDIIDSSAFSYASGVLTAQKSGMVIVDLNVAFEVTTAGTTNDRTTMTVEIHLNGSPFRYATVTAFEESTNLSWWEPVNINMPILLNVNDTLRVYAKSGAVHDSNFSVRAGTATGRDTRLIAFFVP